MSLPTKPLGKNGPQVNQLGLGLMGLSTFYGPAKPDPERFAFLDAAYEKGERFWDTSDLYGDSEELLGKWFKANPDKRKDIFLATKFASVMLPDGTYTTDISPNYAKKACAKSLERLGLPSVDLYYVHRMDKVTPIEKTMQALVELKNEGKFQYIGLSECSADTIRRAHAVHPVTAVQVEYSPFSLDIESKQIDVLRTCRELGVATVAYSPLGRGLITGQYTSPDDFDDGDIRKWLPRFSKENFPKNLELVEKLKALGQKKNATPSQLALAWLLAQGDDIFPIPGTQRIERLEENIGSVNLQLTKEEEQEIRRAAESAEIVGGRYPDMLKDSMFADTPAL